jgi:hypothetical protein
MLFTVPYSCGFYRKPYSGFKNPYKKSAKLELIHEEYFVEQKNKGRKSDKNSSLRRLKFMPPEISTKTAVQEFHLRIRVDIYIFRFQIRTLRKRSGLKSSGSGQYSGSWWTTWMGIPTIVPDFKSRKYKALCALYKLKVRRCFQRSELGKKQGKTTAAAEEKLSFYPSFSTGWDWPKRRHPFRDRRPCTTACPGCWVMGTHKLK